MVLKPSSIKAIPNTFLRKKRKWPHSPYKTQWHFTFNQQQALLNLKQSSLNLPTNPIHQQQQLTTTQNPPKTLIPFLLNCLIDSFSKYNCEPTINAYHFVIKTLIRNSQFRELNHVLSHLQNVEKFETPERVFVDLIRVYGENDMVVEAIDLFFRIPRFRCVPTVDSLNSLLMILCRDRNSVFFRFVPQLLLKSTRVLNIRIEESSFSILISALCRIKRPDYAIKLLYYMIDDGFSPDNTICTLILSSLYQQRGVILTSFEVMGIFEGMKKTGFCPRRLDFRNLIKFLVKQGKGEVAFDTLCEMKREGIKPDIACYTMVLHGVVEERAFAKAEELFDEILVFGLVPVVGTYNAYINGLCKQGKVDDAYMMISSMKELGCQPNLVTYRIVLEAFSKVGELSRARDLWRDIKNNGMEIDMQVYGIMIDVLITGREVIDACNLSEEMMSNSSARMSSKLDDVICSLCRGGFVSEALHTLVKVYANGFAPGSRAWETLLIGMNLNLDKEDVVLANLINLHRE